MVDGCVKGYYVRLRSLLVLGLREMRREVVGIGREQNCAK